MIRATAKVGGVRTGGLWGDVFVGEELYINCHESRRKFGENLEKTTFLWGTQTLTICFFGLEKVFFLRTFFEFCEKGELLVDSTEKPPKSVFSHF